MAIEQCYNAQHSTSFDRAALAPVGLAAQRTQRRRLAYAAWHSAVVSRRLTA
jgi:hypothetical protein